MIRPLTVLKFLENILDIRGEQDDIRGIKPAAPLQVCAIRWVFFCPDSKNFQADSLGMPAEPLGFIWNLMLNSGGFFFVRQQRKEFLP